MSANTTAFEANRKLWNERTKHHVGSKFYDVEGFVAGKNSLTEIELDLLGDVAHKTILHLQCHFGQDMLSLARMGAVVTGLDFSVNGLTKAQKLADRCKLKAGWILSNVIDHRPELNGKFDIV